MIFVGRVFVLGFDEGIDFFDLGVEFFECSFYFFVIGLVGGMFVEIFFVRCMC